MSKKILLVDDEADILKIVILRLSKAGYEVTIAADGKEALDKAQKDKPDLILMDYIMPVLDGMETCRILKKDNGLAHIPVIFMSASSSAINAETVKSVGGSDYITKPFEFPDLFNKIQKLIKE